MLDGIASVVAAGLNRRRGGRQELGTRKREATLKLAEVSVLHLEHFLVVVLFAEHLGMKRFYWRVTYIWV